MMQDKIEYVLIVQINGQEVFNARYDDTYEVQEIGLDKAENAVSAHLDSDGLEPEEMSYIHHLKDKNKFKNHRKDEV